MRAPPSGPTSQGTSLVRRRRPKSQMRPLMNHAPSVPTRSRSIRARHSISRDRERRFIVGLPPMQPAVAPGPSSLFGLGSWPALWSPRERIFRHLEFADRFGDVVRHQIGSFVVHVIRHPEDIKHVLQENHANYTKGWGLQRMKPFLGEGLLTSEGEHWRRQR